MQNFQTAGYFQKWFKRTWFCFFLDHHSLFTCHYLSFHPWEVNWKLQVLMGILRKIVEFFAYFLPRSYFFVAPGRIFFGIDRCAKRLRWNWTLPEIRRQMKYPWKIRAARPGATTTLRQRAQLLLSGSLAWLLPPLSAALHCVYVTSQPNQLWAQWCKMQFKILK